MTTQKFWIRDDGAAAAFGLDPTLLPALDAVQGAMQRGPRRYAANPAADADVTQFHLTTRGVRVYEDEGPDAAEFFAAQMSPSDSTFR